MGIEVPAHQARDIAPEVREFSATTRHVAALAAFFINESWRGEAGDPERMALRHTLITDERCLQTLKGPLSALPLSPLERYELQATCLVVHHEIPFTHEERRSLIEATGSWNESPDVWDERATDHHKELLDAWSGWLERGKTFSIESSKRDIVYSEAVTLEHASNNLATLLGTILGHR